MLNLHQDSAAVVHRSNFWLSTSIADFQEIKKFWYNAIISQDQSESEIELPCVVLVVVCQNHIQSPVWNLVIHCWLKQWMFCVKILFNSADFMRDWKDRWIMYVLTVLRIILLYHIAEFLKVASLWIRSEDWHQRYFSWNSPESVQEAQDKQTAKLNYFLCISYLLLALSFVCFFGYIFTSS